jgi:menaquinol-cytochrome c reductase iron-sulfur subunit
VKRRDLLEAWRLWAGGLVGLGLLPSALHWWGSARRDQAGGGGLVDVGPVDELTGAGWQARPLSIERRNRWRLDRERHTVYVRRLGDGFEVLSAVCPHASCLVKLEGAGFACPCHRTLFDGDGRPTEGPARRALDRLSWKLEQGRLKVRFQRFRPGTSGSEPLEP